MILSAHNKSNTGESRLMLMVEAAELSLSVVNRRVVMSSQKDRIGPLENRSAVVVM